MPSDPPSSVPGAGRRGGEQPVVKVGPFAARYGDGHHAGSQPAAVWIGSDGLELKLTERAPPLVWPAHDLEAASPLTPRADHVLLTSRSSPGATVFVADAQFAAAVARVAPHLTARASGWRVIKPLLMVTAAVGLLASGLWFWNVSPARGIAGAIPESVRRNIGRKVVAEFAENRTICNAEPGKAALGRLVARLAAGDPAHRAVSVTVLDWSLINAFAAPGGQIVLTRGIIGHARNPDELAGILAHEMGHGRALHPETAIIRAVGLFAALELIMGGGSGTLGNLGIVLTQLGYSRLAEREADSRAVAILNAAGISPVGLVEFFKRLDTRERKQGNGDWDVLRTHPPSAERASAITFDPRAATTPAMTFEDWEALRRLCGPDRIKSDAVKPQKG